MSRPTCMEIGQFVYMSRGELMVPRQAVATCVISSRVRAGAAGSQSVLLRFGGQMVHHALSVRFIPALVLHQIGKSDAALSANPAIVNGIRRQKLDEEWARQAERIRCLLRRELSVRRDDSRDIAVCHLARPETSRFFAPPPKEARAQGKQLDA